VDAGLLSIEAEKNVFAVVLWNESGVDTSVDTSGDGRLTPPAIAVKSVIDGNEIEALDCNTKAFVRVEYDDDEEEGCKDK
jgi:hypothetical protein